MRRLEWALRSPSLRCAFCISFRQARVRFNELHMSSGAANGACASLRCWAPTGLHRRRVSVVPIHTKSDSSSTRPRPRSICAWLQRASIFTSVSALGAAWTQTARKRIGDALSYVYRVARGVYLSNQLSCTINPIPAPKQPPALTWMSSLSFSYRGCGAALWLLTLGSHPSLHAPNGRQRCQIHADIRPATPVDHYPA